MLEEVEGQQGTGEVDVGMLIVDEAHHAMAKSYQDMLEWLRSTYQNVLVLYLTATPFRGDGQELTSISRELFRFPLAEAMRLSYVKQVSFHEIFWASAKFRRMEDYRTDKYPHELKLDTQELDDFRKERWLQVQTNNDVGLTKVVGLTD